MLFFADSTFNWCQQTKSHGTLADDNMECMQCEHDEDGW